MNTTAHIRYKKKRIPAALRRLVWHTYIGESVGRAPCWCCEVTPITQLSFHCGHVISEKLGGALSVENLRPICQNCNSSMRTRKMTEFKDMLSRRAADPMEWEPCENKLLA